MFDYLITIYADLGKVAQLLDILALGVPDVGPFLKMVACWNENVFYFYFILGPYNFHLLASLKL
jgi:hypothetical protein